MRIGVDLGGTKIEAIALGDDGKELARRRVDTPRAYEPLIDAIVDLVLDIERASGRGGGGGGGGEDGATGTVGVGIPGAVVPETGLVKNANSLWLNGQPLGADLERSLGRPVRLMNDANCFALSEATDGAGAGADVVFGVILGTGVGAGIVVGGRCLVGPNLIAGEWGHNPLPWPRPDEYEGPPCYCGKRGCIEAWLSGPGFENDHRVRTGEALPSREIVRRAGTGEPEATATLALYYDRLARALASIINVLDPDVIVLGGGMSNVPRLAQAVSDLLPRYVFSDTVLTRVLRNVHGDSSGVRGAAWLWPENKQG